MRIAPHRVSGILAIGVALVLLTRPAHGTEQKVSVYSHRHYPADKALFVKFTSATGIQVEVLKAKADELIQRLEIEGRNSPADLLITVDAGRLYRARQKGLLQAVRSPALEHSIPEHLRDPQGFWYGLTMRARVIVFAKDRVEADDLSSYEALADPSWKGRLLIRSSGNIYNQSLLASMIAVWGRDAAKTWAADVISNMARTPKGNDRDQMKAVAAGIGDIAVVNTYYLGLLLNSSNPEERKVGRQLGVFFPNQSGRGTHVNISGAGVTKHAPNRANAIALLEFLAGDAAQREFAAANHEYPVNPEVEWPALLKKWGVFKPDKLSLTLLGRHNREATKIFDEVGWR